MIPVRIAKVLDLARWAPSGDNTQPWRFEILDESNFVVHGHDTRDWCVYDLDGRASQIAIGALLETIAIAASDQGLRAEFELRPDLPESRPTVDVRLEVDSGVRRDALVDVIEKRVTQRRPFTTAQLTGSQKRALADSLGSGHSVIWFEGASVRWRMAKLLFKSANVRLTIPEAYEVHKQIIEWDAQFSQTKIPDRAVGLDPVALKLMRWAMGSWRRVDFLNKYLAGTLVPRLQLDLVPAMRCGAHFMILASEVPDSVQDFLNGGRAMQRFWLTATQQGLQFQPEMTPLIFSRFVGEGIRFSGDQRAQEAVQSVAAELRALSDLSSLNKGVFMGRVGVGNSPVSRSTRLSLDRLLS